MSRTDDRQPSFFDRMVAMAPAAIRSMVQPIARRPKIAASAGAHDLFAWADGIAPAVPSTAFRESAPPPRSAPAPKPVQQTLVFPPTQSKEDNAHENRAPSHGAHPQVPTSGVQQDRESGAALRAPVAGTGGPGRGGGIPDGAVTGGVHPDSQHGADQTGPRTDADSGRDGRTSGRSSLKVHAAANIFAIRTAKAIGSEGRTATETEREILSRYRGWGGIPQIFDDRPEWQELQDELKAVTDAGEYAACRFSTINAHYTGDGVSREMWRLVRSLGFDGGSVLEPGCGRGVFIDNMPADLASKTKVTGARRQLRWPVQRQL